MKTRDLIKRLQKIDPEGDGDVCVDNIDVYTVTVKPSYWDGCLQLLDRDESNPYYNVIGGRYRSSGSKICIESLSIHDAISDNADLPVVYESDYVRNKYQERDDKWREEVRAIEAAYRKDK